MVTYIPAAQIGDRNSQYWGAWRQAWVAENRSRCEPQSSQEKCSVTPYGRVSLALVRRDACGRAVVGLPTSLSQSSQSGIGVSKTGGAKSAEAIKMPCGMSRQFVAPYNQERGA